MLRLRPHWHPCEPASLHEILHLEIEACGKEWLTVRVKGEKDGNLSTDCQVMHKICWMVSSFRWQISLRAGRVGRGQLSTPGPSRKGPGYLPDFLCWSMDIVMDFGLQGKFYEVETGRIP